MRLTAFIIQDKDGDGKSETPRISRNLNLNICAFSVHGPSHSRTLWARIDLCFHDQVKSPQRS